MRDPASHAERGCNVGWLYKTRSDAIFYYFIERDELIILNTLSLKQWAFEAPLGSTDDVRFSPE